MIRRHTRSTRFPYDALPIYKGPLRWRVNIDHKEIAYGIPEPVEQLKRRNSRHMVRISPLELLDRFWNPIRNFLVVDRKSTRLNSSHRCISYAVFCLKKKKII